MEKIVGGLKAQGPGKALVWLLAAAALSVPDFSRATAYVVSLPDAAYPFPVLLGALAALYAMFANRLPRCRGALARRSWSPAWPSSSPVPSCSGRSRTGTTSA